MQVKSKDMHLVEISELFPTELDCVKYAEQLRWGADPQCAYCYSTRLMSRKSDYRFTCTDCGKSSTVTVGTYLHDTRVSLKHWFFAISLIAGSKKGISARQLERFIGVSYKTAWRMYMTIRSVMEYDGECLCGVVEMDETYVGGKPRKARKSVEGKITEDDKANYDAAIAYYSDDFKIKEGDYKKPYRTNVKRGRGTAKIPVVGIVERDGNVIAEVMRGTHYENLRDMVERHVCTDNALLLTDAYRGYDQMSELIDHIKIDHQRFFSYRGLNTNSIESFWAIVKRGIMGQYHAVSLKYLPKYINEFVYKYNNRSKSQYQIFDEVLIRLLEVNLLLGQ